MLYACICLLCDSLGSTPSSFFSFFRVFRIGQVSLPRAGHIESQQGHGSVDEPVGVARRQVGAKLIPDDERFDGLVGCGLWLVGLGCGLGWLGWVG